ncbi:MAG: hypothetical protein A2896_02135 [Candidatus Nealsonbacteria bacterium RIFCSPLOWO2_01_FULL_43_32]|uniref:HhH-GPD domain-containing protein n=1 Tax=Candidatus Nealsonbacteria bacterium RIFCSPLOWO2_01_FULL_43_32 TaxID=1801672 RepID=A0A1G2EGI8_9BACT|nr:MAG: hypothetical protein A2896_02135 [Candidatus Nealsonbacteria bacterium RIFCSPLOWO2_01_FULL_43_32]
MTKIYKLYLSLLKKYQEPQEFWQRWCKTEKTGQDRTAIVLGAILTQRTNWRNVELALKNLKKAKALSVEKVCRINRRSLEKLIKPAGFYRQKAKRLIGLCRFIVKNHKTLEKFFTQSLPTCREQLLVLKGVGPETADSILLYAGHKPIFVIDEYTRRFAKKRHLSDNLSYDYLQQLFQKNLPRNVKIYQDFHALIVLEGKGS